KQPLLGVDISITNYDQIVRVVLDHAKSRAPLRFTALDAHGLSRAAKNKNFRDLLNSFEIVSPDGHSLQWALNQLYDSKLSDRVAGPDLTLRLCHAAAQARYPIFLYGSYPQVVSRFRDRLNQLVPSLVIAGLQPSRFRPSSKEEDEE